MMNGTNGEGTFRHAAKMLKLAWQHGTSDHAANGFLFDLRYNNFDASLFAAATRELSTLPSFGTQLAGEREATLEDFRQFVRYAWSIPIYLERKKADLILRMPKQEAEIRGCFDNLRREIQRVLGMHEFGI